MATQQPPPVDTNTTTTPVVPQSQIKRQPAPIEVPLNVTPIPLSEIDRAPATLPVTSTPVVIPLSSIDTAPAAVTEDPAVANDAPPVVSDVATVSETVLTPTPTPLESVRIGPVYLPTAQDGTVIVPRTTLLNFQGAGVTVSSFNGLVANITIAGSTSYGDANVINLLSSGIAGNIMPSANTTWNLGNATNQWNSLWVASNTIYIGGVPLSVAPGNTLTLAGEPLLSNDSATTITTTGNITANYIIGDGAQISNVAWANITGAPSFITLGNLSVTTASPSGNGSLSYNNTSGVFTYTPADANLSQYGDANVAGFLASFGSNVISTTGNITANYFIGDGSLLTGISSTGNITFTDTTMSPPDGQDLVISAANSQVDIQALDFRVVTTDDVRITGNDVVSLRNLSTTDPISIITDYDNTQKSWEFGADGTLTAPGDITTAGDITGTAGASTLVLRAQPASNTSLQLNDSVDSAILTVANFEILSNVSGTAQTWTFGTDGVLTAPGNITTTGNISAGNISTGVITLTNGATIRDTSGDAVAFGQNAGLTSQGNFAVGIGRNAGQTTQGGAAVAIGVSAGDTSQGNSAVAVGQSAGFTNQSANTVAVGVGAGQTSQGVDAVAVGASAGSLTQGIAAVAIGTLAGRTFQANNSIILNATGANLDQTTANTFTVAPVRNDVANVAQVMFYNTTSKEITYGNTISVAGNISGSNLITAGRVLASGNILGLNFATEGSVQASSVEATGNITGANLSVTGNVSATRLQNDGNLEIRSDVAGTARTWTFDTLGDLNLPVGGNISGSGGISANNITLTGNISGNTAGYAIGYRDIPQVSFTGNATMAATDAGKHFYSTESTNYTLTIADNSAVSWPVGTAITVVNRGTGNITVAQASGVSLYLAGNSTAGNRTVTTYGMVTLLNVAANVWMINGTGVV